jgi:1,4-alpha-glucan branching enzyme
MQNLFNILLNPDFSGAREHCLEKLRPFHMERLDSLIRKYPALLSGAFFLRSTSRNGSQFSFPDDENGDKEVVAWSRMSDDHEILCAMNLAQENYACVYVTVDDVMHPIDSSMRCLFASDLSPAELNIEVRNGKAVRLTIPPQALVIYC